MTMPTVLHTCPACKDWQIDYTLDTLITYVPPGTPPFVASGLTHALVDDLVLDHLLDCYGVPK